VATDPEQIKREIEDIRAELADTVDELSQRMSPKAVAGRSVTVTKDFFGLPTGETSSTTPVAQSIRWERVAAIGSLVVLLVLRRRRKKRKKRA
jgi:hypothetical protein